VALDPIQIRFLRGLAHDLNPIVMIGQKGMSDGVRVELDDALSRHELVKIRVVAEEREERDQIIQALVRDTRSELIQKVGHTATFYRRAKKPKLVLPGEKPAKREEGFGERPSRDGQRPFRARRNEVGGGYGERPQRAADPADTRVRRSEPRPPRREGGKYAKPPGRSAAGGFSKRPPRAEDIVGAAPRRERSFGGRADGPTHRPARPARDFGDRPARPARDFGNRPKRDLGDRPARPSGNFADRPKRDFGDRPARPARDFGDRPARPARDFADQPKRDFGDRPARPARPSGNFADRPKRDFADRPARPARDLGARPAYKPTGARPSKPAGKPSGSPYKPLGAKRPKREADED
jgi:putative YhbY family RNA-binding protein